MSAFVTYQRKSTLAQYLSNLDPATADLISLMDVVVSNQEDITASLLALQFDGLKQNTHNEQAIDLFAKFLQPEFEQMKNNVIIALGGNP